MSNVIYTVALVKTPYGSLNEVHWKTMCSGFNLSTMISQYLENMEKNFADYEDCEVLYYTSTVNRAEMLVSRIKCESEILEDMVNRHAVCINYHNGSPILDQTYDMCLDLQKVQMYKIGRLISRLLRADEGEDMFKHEITDEVALQCYDMLIKDRDKVEAYDSKQEESTLDVAC